MLAEYIVNRLSIDIDYIFYVPGKNIYPLLSAIDNSNIQGIKCATELGAGFMAEGYSKVANKYGVALAIAGPGFCNMFGSIVNSYYDNSKVLYLLGSHDSSSSGRNSFQDNSIYKLSNHLISANISSYSCLINTSDYFNHLENAFFYLNNVSLPVVVNIPIDVQKYKSDNSTILPKIINRNYLNKEGVKRVREILLTHDILFVTGSRAFEAKQEIARFCKSYHVPVASSLCSKGIISEFEDFYLGVFGFAMSEKTYNYLIEFKPKYVITIGLDFNERNSIKWVNLNSKIIHLDSVLIENSRGYCGIEECYLTDLKQFFETLLLDIELIKYLNQTIYKRILLLNKIKVSRKIRVNEIDNILYADQVIETLNLILANESPINFVIDSGLHRIYCANLLKLTENSSYYSSINNAHMGWAIAASIGIRLGSPKECICITGDGCMLMNGTEIQTAAKYKVKVLFIVINDAAYGAISGAEINSRHYSLPNHNLQQFAESLGMLAITVDSKELLISSIQRYRSCNEPMLLDIKCQYNEHVNYNQYYEQILAS